MDRNPEVQGDDEVLPVGCGSLRLCGQDACGPALRRGDAQVLEDEPAEQPWLAYIDQTLPVDNTCTLGNTLFYGVLSDGAKCSLFL